MPLGSRSQMGFTFELRERSPVWGRVATVAANDGWFSLQILSGCYRCCLPATSQLCDGYLFVQLLYTCTSISILVWVFYNNYFQFLIYINNTISTDFSILSLKSPSKTHRWTLGPRANGPLLNSSEGTRSSRTCRPLSNRRNSNSSKLRMCRTWQPVNDVSKAPSLPLIQMLNSVMRRKGRVQLLNYIHIMSSFSNTTKAFLR